MSNFQPTTNDVIASALALPASERLAVLGAIHTSLADSSIDHDLEDLTSETQVAWQEEIARRLEDIQSGRVSTIPAEEAERMIRGDEPPSV